MIRALLLALVLLTAGCRPGAQDAALLDEGGEITIYSTTDTSALQPVIDDFRSLNPKVRVRYLELDASALDRRFRSELAAAKPAADLLLSSAMDLQVRLVNDGLAAPHRSENGTLLPKWAQWRSEALGFTFEPVVMVFNRDAMQGRAIPASRQQLLDALRRDPAFWRRRIGTYDARTSSVGFLVASQDARQSSDFGALAEALRDAEVVTAGTTSALLDRLDRGELALGYNLLGSYARARAMLPSSRLQIVYPADYTLAVARTAVIPRSARHPRLAHAFLEYLLSLRGQRVLTTRSQLSAIRPEIESRYSRLGLSERSIGPLRPISLGPGLLVYLDQQKHERLLRLWAAENQAP